MMLVKNIFLVFIVLFSTNSYGGNEHTYTMSNSSISERDMEKYTKECEADLSIVKIEKSLGQGVKKKELKKIDKNNTGYYYEKLNKIFTHMSFRYVNIDGFIVKDMSIAELATLMQMTAPRVTKGPPEVRYKLLWKPKYEYIDGVRVKVLSLKRACLVDSCTGNLFKLKKERNKNPLCQNISCASKRLFGDPKGIYLAHAMDKYGLQLSKYSHPNADPKGFSTKELKSILLAAESTPPQLRNKTLIGKTFYRNLRSEKPKPSDISTIAGSKGAVFNPFDKLSPSRKIELFAHEIGHRAAVVDYADLSDSTEWLNASGFIQGKCDKKKYHCDYTHKKKRKSVSKYGDKNPEEDIAESYLMYRFTPKKLKKLSPKRYHYLKENIFNGLVYTEDLCNGTMAVEYSLTIKVTPSDARVQITNIIPRYKDGILLEKKIYNIKVSKKGYKTQEFKIDLMENTHREVTLLRN